MAATRANARARHKKADNRRAYHEAQIAASAGVRDRLVRIAGWLTAEVQRLPADAQQQVINDLFRLARQTHERNRDDNT